MKILSDHTPVKEATALVQSAVQFIAVMMGTAAAVLATASSQVWPFPAVAAATGAAAALFSICAFGTFLMWFLAPVLTNAATQGRFGHRVLVFAVTGVFTAGLLLTVRAAIDRLAPVGACLGATYPRPCRMGADDWEKLDPSSRAKYLTDFRSTL